MPSYTYKCDDCKKEFVVVRKMTEETKTCQHCNSAKIRQLIQPSNFHLKGSGWFKDGY